LNSEAIVVIVGIGCLLLVIAIFQFVPKISLLLKRLARIEFRNSKNQQTKTVNIASKDTKPWTWYKTWITTLFYPSTYTGKALLSEGMISFRQAIVWLIVVSALSQLITSAIAVVKNPVILTLKGVFDIGLSSFLAGVISPISAIILTGGIHLCTKLFGGRGTWRNFFIVWVSFNAPLLILYYLLAFVVRTFAIQGALIFAPLLSFYWLLVVNPMAIKSNYSFRWLGSCLINLFVTMAYFVVFIGLFWVFNPGLFKR
jgi:hypothetical protein